MKRFFAAIALAVALATVVPVTAYADWNYGTIHFKGTMPKKAMTVGTVKFFYNGTLKKVGSRGTVDLYECTGECCVAFPKGYNGRKIEVKSPKPVQIQYAK